jgi:hypothetical protein
MMNFGGGLVGWLGPLIMLGLLVGVVLVVIWAAQGGGRGSEDDALAALRTRFARGATVRWFNDDALPHTVSASDGAWDSGNLAPGQTFERRYDEPGSYPYLCRYHPGMVGTIEVEG